MTTLIACFLASLAVAVLLTPQVRQYAIKFGVLDQPGGRRVHARPTPRAGGVAVYLAFLPVFLFAIALHDVLGLTPIEMSSTVVALAIATTIVFALGLVDDVRGLSARTKILIQAAAALVAWSGGVNVAKLGLPFVGSVELGLVSIPVTIFWFLLLANAINLIDGLDGLAAGIVFFASVTMLAVFTPGANLAVAIGLACLSGATLGFLRYNFNPASIFLGDSGSYLLGFTFAGLTVLGSIKTQAAVGLLIPVVALGVPLIDVLWSPIRRFLLGRRLFTADMDHIHHRLVSMGWTTRRAVLTLYGMTVLMAAGAVLLTHTRSERTALVLVLIGAGAIFAIRKLGYFDFIRPQGVRRWLGAVADEMGLARARRAFLAREIELQTAQTIDDIDEALRGAASDLGVLSLQVELGPSLTGHAGRRLTAGPIGQENGDQSRHLLVSMPLSNDDPEAGHLRAIVSMDRNEESPNVARRLDGIRRGLVSSRWVLATQREMAQRASSHAPKTGDEDRELRQGAVA